ncbi:transcriptional regulator [Xenorhabdus beddingii]|uniref:Transcriptional regulator n=2 Tax=Xenorhabdus beddingii TaxID=40578 RepID=A0A1Y2SQ77_9GAMM|nr:transcriptional regulator [Xenorhabdus beddingii]
MRKSGENKSSLAMRSGVTRTTLYKILDGQINKVQHSTITRIADFFGVRCDVIEHCDLEELDRIDNTLSVEGNKNPSAIPLIPQSEVLSSMDVRIGQLIMKYPVTWAFEEGSNLIGLTVETEISKTFFPGDTLIIKRNATPVKNPPSLIYTPEKGFYLHDLFDRTKKDLTINEKLIGTIIEERIS